MKKKKNCKETILDAAEDVVVESGAVHMTLDAVCSKAGVSKGGLLYHFPNKESLIDAMLLRLVERFETARSAASEKMREDPRRNIKAHVTTFLSRDKRMNKVCAAFVAAAAHNPNLISTAKRSRKKAFEKLVAPDMRWETAAVIALAVDGLLLTKLLGIAPFNAREQKAIIDELLKIANE